jgi:hypothetical protein
MWTLGRQPPKVITEVTLQPYYNVRVLHSSSMQHLRVLKKIELLADILK